MCTLFHQLCFEAVFGSIDAQGLKVDIEPVKGVAFDILVLHLEVYLSVVITGKVDNNTAIFLFEQIAQVAVNHSPQAGAAASSSGKNQADSPIFR